MLHVLCHIKKKFPLFFVKYVSKYEKLSKHVCTVTACARRVVTELISERFPAIRFHSLPAIATIIVS